MKKRFLLFAALTLSTSFAACSKDEDLFDAYKDDIQWIQELNAEEGRNDDNVNEGKNDDNKNGGREDSLRIKEDSLYITSLQYYMPQQASSPSLQGAALWGNYIFQCENYNKRLTVYDVVEKKYVGEIPLVYNKYYHNNQAAFSNIYFEDSDEFPLLYVSQILIQAQNIQVYRIQRQDTLFNATLVQVIRLPNDTDENNLAHCNIVFDKLNHFYLYSRNRTTCMGQISKWKIPDPHKGDVILREEHMLDHFSLSYSLLYAQGGTMLGDKIYFGQGIPGKSDLMLRIVDVKTHDEFSFDLKEMKFYKEPEGLMLYDGNFVLSTNRGGFYYLSLSRY